MVGLHRNICNKKISMALSKALRQTFLSLTVLILFVLFSSIFLRPSSISPLPSSIVHPPSSFVHRPSSLFLRPSHWVLQKNGRSSTFSFQSWASYSFRIPHSTFPIPPSPSPSLPSSGLPLTQYPYSPLSPTLPLSPSPSLRCAHPLFISHIPKPYSFPHSLRGVGPYGSYGPEAAFPIPPSTSPLFITKYGENVLFGDPYASFPQSHIDHRP